MRSLTQRRKEERIPHASCHASASKVLVFRVECSCTARRCSRRPSEFSLHLVRPTINIARTSPAISRLNLAARKGRRQFRHRKSVLTHDTCLALRSANANGKEAYLGWPFDRLSFPCSITDSASLPSHLTPSPTSPLRSTSYRHSTLRPACTKPKRSCDPWS